MRKFICIAMLLLVMSIKTALAKRYRVACDYECHGEIGRGFFDFPNNETWAFRSKGWFTISFKYLGDDRNVINIRYTVEGLGDYIYNKTLHNIRFHMDDTYKDKAYYVTDFSDNLIIWLLPDREYRDGTYLIWLEDKKMIAQPKRKRRQ